MAILKDIFLVLQGLASLALIVIIASQTTKSEGLTGSIGGQVTASFKGKPGIEEQVRRITVYISVLWFAVSIVTAFLFART